VTGAEPGARGLVLVVEDDRAIADLVRLYLRRDGFGVQVEADGAAALDAVGRLHPVAVVLDIGLPGLDGVEVCRRLRAADDWTPVLFMTARDDEVDRIVGLELGADDYVTKPFSPRELVARVRAVLRRADGVPTRVVSMPCQEWFRAQDVAYRTQVLPPSVKARVSVEAGVAMSWHDLVGEAGECVSLEHFGASAPYQVIFEQFGFTPDHVVAAARASLARVGEVKGSTTGN